jgi:ribosomal protein S18 acetylase RimI-like enzyme
VILRRVGGRLVDTWRRFGGWAVLRLVVDRLVNRALRVITIIWFDGADRPGAQPVGAGFDYRFLEPEEVRWFANDPRNDLGAEFAERAAHGHDVCFAALTEDELVAYCWYALESVEIRHTLGVALSYPPDVAYMYKAYTHPPYRGGRHQGTAAQLALQQLGPRGITKLVALVDWTNSASLRAFERSGFVRLGRVWILRLPRGSLVIAPRRAKARGIRFGRTAVPRPALAAAEKPAARAA